MLKVGITGGIGAGKSTVCQIFEVLGVPHYNADERARHLMNNQEELITNIKSTFGEDSYHEGQINRGYLAKKVFAHGNEVKKLNALVHPLVARDFEYWLSQQTAPCVIKEAALLIETEGYKSLDVLINVSVSEEERVKRVLSRDSFRSEEEVKGIIAKQTSESRRNELVDHIIDNSGEVLLIPQVLNLHELLLRKVKN